MPQLDLECFEGPVGERASIYTDAGVINPTTPDLAIGGIGLWIPGGDIEDLRGAAIWDYANFEQLEDGVLGWAAYGGQSMSSTRGECIAIALGILLDGPHTIGADSAGAVYRAGKLLRRRGTTRAVDTGVAKDADAVAAIGTYLEQRGWRGVGVRKVKGHADERDIEAGETTYEDMKGNNMADEGARRGQRIWDPRVRDLVEKLADRHSRYCQFMKKFQTVMVAAALRSAAAHAGRDPEAAPGERGRRRARLEPAPATSLAYPALEESQELRCRQDGAAAGLPPAQQRVLAAITSCRWRPAQQREGLTLLELLAFLEVRGCAPPGAAGPLARRESLATRLRALGVALKELSTKAIVEEQASWLLTHGQQSRRLASLGLLPAFTVMQALPAWEQPHRDRVRDLLLRLHPSWKPAWAEMMREGVLVIQPHELNIQGVPPWADGGRAAEEPGRASAGGAPLPPYAIGCPRSCGGTCVVPTRPVPTRGAWPVVRCPRCGARARCAGCTHLDCGATVAACRCGGDGPARRADIRDFFARGVG